MKNKYDMLSVNIFIRSISMLPFVRYLKNTNMLWEKEGLNDGRRLHSYVYQTLSPCK
jgi:hypothetical protein